MKLIKARVDCVRKFFIAFKFKNEGDSIKTKLFYHRAYMARVNLISTGSETVFKIALIFV